MPPPKISPEILEKARSMSPRVGFAAGLYGALVGVGGGVIIVPWIVNACKTIPQRLVSGTSLAAVLSTAVTSAGMYAQNQLVDIPAAMLIGSSAMIAAPFGARLTVRMDCSALRRTLGWFLVCVSPLIPLKAFLLSSHEAVEDSTHSGGGGSDDTRSSLSSATVKEITSHSTTATFKPQQQQESYHHTDYIADAMISIQNMPSISLATYLGIGSLAGVASGLLGIGGGTIVTPFLALSLLSASQATILGTSLCSMIAPSTLALLQHARLGNVDVKMAAGLAAGTALGSVLGSSLAIQAPPGVLEGLFSVGMLFLGRKTLQSAAAAVKKKALA